MPQKSTPRVRIGQLVLRRGERAVATGCAALLSSAVADDDELVVALGGDAAASVLEGRDKPYWLRVWGARGLLYAWDDEVVPALVDATRDDEWRVREMVAKVVAKRRIDDAAGAIARLRGDAVPRVRAAAERALVMLAAP